jgi:hypothetical protein
VRSALLQTETGRPPCGITVTLLFDERDKEMSLAPSSGVSPNPRAHGWICSAAPVLTASAPLVHSRSGTGNTSVCRSKRAPRGSRLNVGWPVLACRFHIHICYNRGVHLRTKHSVSPIVDMLQLTLNLELCSVLWPRSGGQRHWRGSDRRGVLASKTPRLGKGVTSERPDKHRRTTTATSPSPDPLNLC